MAKINITAFRQVEPVTEKRSFADPDQPDVDAIELQMKAEPGTNTVYAIQAMAAGFVKQFAGPSGYPLYGLNERRLEVSEKLCSVIATIMSMEQLQDDGGRYQFEDWVKISYYMRNAFLQIAKWASDLIEKVGDEDTEADGSVKVPNDSAASTGNTSEPPQTTTPPVIPS